MDDDCVRWSESYSVGFDIIDNQHKELVKMTNTLLNGCKMGGSAAEAAFMKTVRDAIQYAQTHFFTEEKYMRLSKFPELDVHKQEHENFIITVKNAVKEYEEKKSDPGALARFLKEWLLNHIAQSDKKYAPYLKTINNK